ncbi:type II toxin-antitoxin system RelE/ParE family toxin [Rhizobium jaguaris]|uniref:type II toxin-antitoxin system RelE/ParE family toxin n=1 Tax=Rhizobium jaguaris TaxID=1312183 RepID=UPI0039BFAE5B
MKRYSVAFRGAAQADLRSIFNYVHDRSQSRQTALSYVRRIRERCEKIGDAPFGGVARPDIGINLRMAVFERSIVILYIVEGDRVRITNMIAGGRDYEALLRSQL